jgi:cystathionine beta-lyase
MKSLKTIPLDAEHHFVKHDSQLLKTIFGSDDIASFWIADMDFMIAPEISEELQRIVNRGVYSYELDIDSIFESITKWYQARHNLMLNSKSFIQVTSVLTGISVVIRELTNEGDSILIQTPVYHHFKKVIKTSNRKVISNPLKIVNGRYQMDLEDLESKIKSESVKIIILCNPHNPVGRVWNKEEIQKLKDLADYYNVTIISDEIHSDITYQNHSFNSITSFDQNNHIAVLGSPAKTFGMQSISNGYLYISNNKLFKRINHTVESMYLGHGNPLTAYATIAAYDYGAPWLDELITYLKSSLDWITKFIENELPDIKLNSPEGTYQIWLDFSGLNLSDNALTELVFKKAKLGLAPGAWFDQNHSQFMRMNIASPLSNIQDAFKQLKQAIDENL